MKNMYKFYTKKRSSYKQKMESLSWLDQDWKNSAVNFRDKTKLSKVHAAFFAIVVTVQGYLLYPIILILL